MGSTLGTREAASQAGVPGIAAVVMIVSRACCRHLQCREVPMHFAVHADSEDIVNMLGWYGAHADCTNKVRLGAGSVRPAVASTDHVLLVHTPHTASTFKSRCTTAGRPSVHSQSSDSQHDRG